MVTVTEQEVAAGRERLRAAVSRMLDVFVARQATAEEFATWSGIAERFAGLIEGLPPESVQWGLSPRGVLSTAGLPPLPLLAGDEFSEPGRVESLVTFGPEHEGPRGCAHGGAIASAFDQLLGLFLPFADPPIVTSDLSIRYIRPIKLGRMVRFEARLVSAGREHSATASAHDGETLCAEATATFVERRAPLPS
jgi:acyl-coenzyme A thioesterase PaaI-like protein